MIGKSTYCQRPWEMDDLSSRGEMMIQIKAMDESYIPPVCLHKGPINPAEHPDIRNVGQDHVPEHPWSDLMLQELTQRHGDMTCAPWQPANHEFHREMTTRFGTCQMLAWEAGHIIGILPFFPVSILQLIRPAWFNAESFDLPPEDLARSLMVRCLMTSRPYFGSADSSSRQFIGSNPSDTPQQAGARRGVGTQLVQGLIAWAREQGWKYLLANAHADIDYAYGMYGCGGKAFWEKSGFGVASSLRKPTPADQPQWQSIIETQAREKGLTLDQAWTWYSMRLAL